MTLRMTRRRRRALAFLVIACVSTGCRESRPSSPPPPQVVQLNQGWSEREAEFYNHANEGTNLAPLGFVLSLPDPDKPGAKLGRRKDSFVNE
jgi:hypothetical protein